MQTYGKLIVMQSGLPEREFELGKASVTLGRATTSDVILGDARVSRSHARIECTDSGCQLVDLGSSNGTRLNGRPVERAALQPGDLLTIGNTQLRYETAGVQEPVGMTIIDSHADLEQSMVREILPMSLDETGATRLIVFTGDKTWEVPLDDTDLVTIGRTDENNLVLPLPKVSRRHAEVVRRGSLFVLRDVGSTNGTWLRGERVTEVSLHDGDAFRIGDSHIAFKAPFSQESLTMIETVAHAERRPVVFVPGMMGSELWRGSERIWPNIKLLFTDPQAFSYPSPVPVEARAIVDEIIIVPNLIKMDQYNRLGDYLVEELGYERGKDFFEFPYDWREDVRVSARKLAQLMDQLPTPRPVMLIGHSLGTMVSRYYVERLGGDRHVERLVLMGGPHTGVVKTLTGLIFGPHVLPFGLLGEKLRHIIATFPSTYQTLPTFPCGVDQNGRQINFLEEETWMPEQHRPLLRAAREFRREIGMQSKVPALSVFGYGIKTLSGASLHQAPDGTLSRITFHSDATGDSTIMEKSAVLPNTEIHPVQQYHGTLFVDNDVKMRLKVELARP